MDPNLVGRRVDVRVSQREISAIALDSGELCCRHERSFAKNRTITALEHAQCPQRTPRARGERASESHSLSSGPPPSFSARSGDEVACGRQRRCLSSPSAPAPRNECFAQALLSTETSAREAHGRRCPRRQANEVGVEHRRPDQPAVGSFSCPRSPAPPRRSQVAPPPSDLPPTVRRSSSTSGRLREREGPRVEVFEQIGKDRERKELATRALAEHHLSIAAQAGARRAAASAT